MLPMLPKEKITAARFLLAAKLGQLEVVKHYLKSIKDDNRA